jgi:ubiquinone/menaquinone biosynthesis C-methylase UbiE
MQNNTPWQLRMFQKTLKKRLRLKALSKLLGTIHSDELCMLVTCGDNNGAMNYFLRDIGGKWSWCELETKSIPEMSVLLDENVHLGTFNQLPFPDNYFDRVISIDCLEHIQAPEKFTVDLNRITKKGGQILITVPGGDPKKFVNRIKHWVGMRKEDYGHVCDGFGVRDLSNIMVAADIEPVKSVTFSKLFTELIELAINFLYVKILAKKSKAKVEQGTIAPATQTQLRAIEKQYNTYAAVFPIFASFSALDKLLIGAEGYVTVVEGRKK